MRHNRLPPALASKPKHRLRKLMLLAIAMQGCCMRIPLGTLLGFAHTKDLACGTMTNKMPAFPPMLM